MTDGWYISLTEEYFNRIDLAFEYDSGKYMVGIRDSGAGSFYYLWYLDSSSEFLDFVKLNDVIQPYYYYGDFQNDSNTVELFYANEKTPEPGTSYLATFDPNGGSWDGSTDPVINKQTYGDYVSFPSTPTKDG